MNLAKRIRDLRYAKGWGPDELASRAKISRTALYQIERGNTSKPQAGTLRRISRALGVPLEVLLDSTPLLGDHDGEDSAPVGTTHVGGMMSLDRPLPTERGDELMEKFRLLLASPLADGIARIVEESFRLLPIIPPPVQSETSRYLAAMDAEPNRRSRPRTQASGE
ncbi:helix-turn-helix domain-containing protein [Paludisphaera mucosa]|uniref:Helix-turn-helix transcriptional regulator n=1 Tax=Paludisphaera mucosa TaxID=3030827 RepID=A0ABT6F7B0_9BACT|nr:helix-turn-helix transcriptional regulator [Paludisphaera mucosa]MDG3003473.1 helix-turn-helix transcriptional regulator [Paludisphaera mucosa]